MAVLIDQAVSVNSHTPTDFGKYDEEPFPVEGNAYYWYLRATYWKRQANRNDGVQATMDFTEKSYAESVGTSGEYVQIHLSSTDRKIVHDYLTKTTSNGFHDKILAIKHVRSVANCGLTAAKDYVDNFFAQKIK